MLVQERMRQGEAAWHERGCHARGKQLNPVSRVSAHAAHALCESVLYIGPAQQASCALSIEEGASFLVGHLHCSIASEAHVRQRQAPALLTTRHRYFHLPLSYCRSVRSQAGA